MIKIYLANLGKYNEGEHVGQWFALPADIEEMKEKIGVSDNTNYEEYAIHDYEAPFHINEYESLDRLNEAAEVIESDPDIKELIKAWEEFSDKKYKTCFQDKIVRLIINISSTYNLEVGNELIHFDELSRMMKEKVNNNSGFVSMKIFLSGLDNTDKKEYFKLNGYNNAQSLTIGDIELLIEETFDELLEVI